MRWQRLIARGVSELNAALPRQRPRAGYRVLMYHAVGTPVPEDRLGIYNISAERFRTHMQLLRHRNDLELVPLHAPGRIDGLTVALTFDDGYRDNLTVAAPILQGLAIPFTVFVIAQAVRKRQQGFLTPEELRELAALPGVTIGAHGDTHTPLTHCDTAQLAAELSDSKRYLEDVIGRPVTAMSYPHGAVNRQVIEAVRRAEYCVAASSRFDINDASADPLALARTDILANDDKRVFLQKIQGDWDWYRWRDRGAAS